MYNEINNASKYYLCSVMYITSDDGLTGVRASNRAAGLKLKYVI